MADGTASVIEWRVPAGARPDWLFGAAATRAERGVIWAGSLIGVGLVGLMYLRGEPGGWAWWQYLVCAVVAMDLFGGAVSNATSSTKRQYFGPDFADVPGIGRLARHPIVFTALHVYPFIIVALFPDGSWAWAAATYAFVVVSAVVLDLVVSPYLQRPVAMLLFVGGVALSVFVVPPPGWAWFPVVFLAKLVLAHAVREEPYRPRVGS